MPDHPIKSPRKLIEVAMPLDAINVESLRRKQKAPKGWPTSLHKWWAQRPVAAARAVLFAQLVNDPGFEHGQGFRRGTNKVQATAERRRLHQLIERLVQWDNSTDTVLFDEVRREIERSWQETCSMNKDHPQAAELFDPGRIPYIEDPFAGSGTIPLEAQRMGLRVVASDLNPVAVTINKALIEIPRRFSGRAPLHPATMAAGTSRDLGLPRNWAGAMGLAEDVRHYGAWLAQAAMQRVGNLYPEISLPGHERKMVVPVAWIWARTVKSPNPAFSHVHVPLAGTFVISTKGDGVYVEPVIEGDSYRFTVRYGPPPPGALKGTKSGRANFRCVLSDVPISPDYIRTEASAGRMAARLMAVVVDTDGQRKYIAPTAADEAVALTAKPEWEPDLEFFQGALGFRVGNYGMSRWSDLFTRRQLATLATLSALIDDARAQCLRDAHAAGWPDDGQRIEIEGTGATAYADAIAVYLALIVDRMAYYGSSLCGWLPKDNAMRDSMPQQTIQMNWDFAEGNPFGKSSSSIFSCIRAVANCLEAAGPNADAIVRQKDARSACDGNEPSIVSTDPPYYDNIGYADLSDFFYVWLRKSLKHVLPSLFATISSPKDEELVATPDRHGGTSRAASYFLDGMTVVMSRLARKSHPAFPVTIYYAFKQQESDESGTSSTGWDTFLAAVLRAGFTITGTWPLRTEGENRRRASNSNALASSVLLVCRLRASDAPTASRREFIRELNSVLPEALEEMTKGSGDERSPLAPVDLSQAIIGPGMAVFSKYAAVLEADGSPMSVRTALQLINRFLAEDDFDADTQFCLHWFEQHGWTENVFGEADVLARSKSTSVDAMKEAGVLQSGNGKVRLLKWAEYPTDWDPRTDARTPVWEALHQLIRALKQGGESASGALLAALGGKAEAVRQLAYRLYTLCERLGQAEDARAYNELITSWTGIESAAATAPKPIDGQLPGFEK